jgi:hypothetical protein
MLNPLRTFFDHSRHKLTVRGVEATFDVLAFDGEECLSQPFTYRIETVAEIDLPTSHTDHRGVYTAVLEGLHDKDGKTL